EQETECGIKPTLWRIPPRNHSFVCLFAHRYKMTALATCFADHHFEFEWIAVADLVDLDHSGLRHYRFVCRASCRLGKRTTLPLQVESGAPSVVPPALHHRVMSGSRLQAISKSQATRDCFAPRSNQRPLYPRKQTLELSRVMSALCQKRTSMALESVSR